MQDKTMKHLSTLLFFSPPHFLQNQKSDANRDATVGNVEHRKRSNGKVICDESVSQAVKQVGKRAAENQSEAHARKSVMRTARREAHQEYCKKNQPFLYALRQTNAECNTRILRVYDPQKTADDKERDIERAYKSRAEKREKKSGKSREYDIHAHTIPADGDTESGV
jgi:hypothetical protein